MGEVFRAIDRQTGEPVALKHVHAGREGEQRFFREARALTLLSHPAIVRYVAHGNTGGGEHYLAMEWLEGQTLSRRLEGGRLPVEEAVDLIRRVAGALAHAHSAGVIHCDLSPGNLLLPDGHAQSVKLLDFGLARHRGDRTEARAWQGPTGTLGYMAPEQARGTEEVDARADLFALGAILFECVTGTPAFGADSYLAVLAKIVVAGAMRLREVIADVPQPLDELCARLLAKNPDDRPESADALLEALAGIGGSRPTLRAPLASAAVAITERERELVSVLLAKRVSDSADRALAGWPDEVRRLARDNQLRTEFLADGSCLLTTAGSGVATDQAARAAAVALEIMNTDPMLAVGIATGWATLERGQCEGEVVERAASLASVAGGIGIDDVTRGLLPPRFQASGARGAYTLTGASSVEQPARLLLGRETPCVGRDRELRTLHAIVDESLAAPVAQAVLMTGPAGSGKSRVRYELIRQLRERHPELAVWVGRGDPMHAGAPFGVLAQALRRATGVLDGEAAQSRREAVSVTVARSVPPEDQARVTEFMAELLGCPFPDSPALSAARQDPLLMSDQLRRAVEDLLSAECRMQPVLLVLEDFQWGDAATVKLLDAALRNLPNLPWTLLAIARPDVHETFPGLWLERNVQELKIGALTRRAAESLIRETAGPVGDAICADLLLRAGGNAFYLEELIRAHVEGRSDGQPDSVLGMVKERIENMEPEARRVLRAASVFGQSFSALGVTTLVGGEAMAAETREWLETLELREVVTRRSGEALASESEYTFRHSLVRDAAYAMLTDRDRMLGHQLAAEHLERIGAADGTSMAEHYERAQAPREAARWRRRAAAEALDAGDFEAAVALAERGLAAEVTGSEAGELCLTRAEALRLSGRVKESLPSVERAISAFEPGTLGWCNAIGERSLILQRLGQSAELVSASVELASASAEPDGRDALALARVRSAVALLRFGFRGEASELVELAENATPLLGPVTRAWVHAYRAVEALLDGAPSRYLCEAERAHAGYLAIGDVRLALEQSISIGSVQMELGVYADAETNLRAALVSAERLGLAHAAAGARHNLGLVLGYLGEFDEAVRLEQAALEAFRNRDQRMLGGAELALAMIHLQSGNSKAGLEAGGRALEVLERSAPPLVPMALATLARLQLAQGEGVSALELSTRAHERLESAGAVEFGAHSIRRAHAEALAANGRQSEAAALVADAARRLHDEAERLADPRLAQCFLEAVVDNRILLELAGAWGVG